MTPAEIAAARQFRSMRRIMLEDLHAAGPNLVVSVFTRYVRHECAARGGVSGALELKEHYAYSPAYLVEENVVSVAGKLVDPDVLRGISRVAGGEFIEPGRFGWIWTQGKCPACQLTALSAAGRLVDPEERPPAEHAIIA